jgi:hypothetical protein
MQLPFLWVSLGVLGSCRKERGTGGGRIKLFGREEEKNLRKNGKCRGYTVEVLGDSQKF